MKIHEIQLQTPSLALVRDFYHGILDLNFQPGSGDSLVFQAGLSPLQFSENPAAKGIYHFAFNIPANQVAAAQDYLHRCSIGMLPGSAGEEIVQFPD